MHDPADDLFLLRRFLSHGTLVMSPGATNAEVGAGFERASYTAPRVFTYSA